MLEKVRNRGQISPLTTTTLQGSKVCEKLQDKSSKYSSYIIA